VNIPRYIPNPPSAKDFEGGLYYGFRICIRLRLKHFFSTTNIFQVVKGVFELSLQVLPLKKLNHRIQQPSEFHNQKGDTKNSETKTYSLHDGFIFPFF
jgi:hypothetical protein